MGHFWLRYYCFFCGMKVGHTNYKGELNAKAECHKVRKRIPINKLNDVDVLGAFS